jgi:hypothetical protein
VFEALLLATLIAAPADAGVLVGIQMEAGRTDLGCFALWSQAPVPGAEGYADVPGYFDAGPLLDDGVPFRTWVTLAFTGRLLSLLNGEFGVGFTPRLWIRPELLGSKKTVGGSGSLRFEGTLQVGVRATWNEETIPVSWSRGFESGPVGDSSEPLSAWSGAVPMETSGVRGPYRWTVKGTLHLDLHVYAQ